MARQALKPLEFNDDRPMTVQEVAIYLQVHRSTIYRLLGQKKLPAFRVGSDWRFSQKAIDQWMKSQEGKGWRSE